MKSKLLAAVLILSGLFVTANKSYACSNQYPVASLTVEPEYVATSESVTLDGSGSYDPDGSITKYEWDWTNNGSYDYYETSSYHPDGAFDGKTTHTYSSEGVGIYTAKLRVTDNDSATHTDTCMVYVIKISVPADVDTIQDAIDFGIDGSIITVSEGTYYETIDFNGVYCTLTSTEPNNPDVVAATIIDANGSGTVVTFNSSEDANIVLKGFTITNGNRGIDCNGVNTCPTITNCTITGNELDGDGAGMRCINSASPTITNCTFSKNTANHVYVDEDDTHLYGGGGGIYCANSASPTITNCTFSLNCASYYGGGMYCTNSASPTVTNCIFSLNYVFYKGGGGGMCNKESSPTVTNCVFSENTVLPLNGRGGGMYNYYSDPNVVSCIFSGNSASGKWSSGGGMYNNYSSPSVFNCTFSGNNAIDHGGGMYNSGSSSSHSEPDVTNCIFWGDSAGTGNEIYNGSNADPNVTYCDIEPTGRVSHWKFDEGEGDIAYDSAGDNDGTVYGATWTTGQIDGALDFDGAGDYVDCGTGVMNFTGNSPFSVFAWVKLPGTSGDNYILGTTINTGWYIRAEDSAGGGVLLAKIDDGTDYAYGDGDTPINDSQWHFAGMVINGTHLLGYVDGIEEINVSYSNVGDLDDHVRVGMVSPNNHYLDGTVDDVRIYNRALSAGEVQQLYMGEGGNIDSDPGFADVNNPAGLDGIFGTLDDGLRLRRSSGCIDAADGDVAPLTDMTGRARIDVDYVDNTGTGNPNYADIGAYESLIIWFVDVDATGSNNGSSWGDAFVDLQNALSAANDANDEIWVAEGTYEPNGGGDRSISFDLVEGAGVYGGFAGTEFCRPQRDRITYQTILSGDIGTVDDQDDNSYHVVKGADGAVLDGFTITGGNANGSGADSDGGGIYCSDVSPTISNCTIIENYAAGYGGGIYDCNSSSTAANCFFIENGAYFGGGIYDANSSLIVTNCVFRENLADVDGGGMYNYNSSPSVTNGTFSKNSANYDGGGICNYGSSSSPTVTNCILWGNNANGSGDQMALKYSSVLVNYSDIEGYTEPIQGRVSHWKFDEGEGTIAYDSVGNNDGTLNGDPSWVTGMNNSALSFDGSGDYVDCGTGVMNFAGNSPFSVFAWVKLPAEGPGTSGDNYILGTTIDTGWYIRVKDYDGVGVLLAKIDDGTDYAYGDGDTPINDSQWHFAGMVINGTHLLGYVDGIEEINVSYSNVDDLDDHVRLGMVSPPYNNHYVDGTVDDVRIYDRALSSGEVRQLYQNGLIYMGEGNIDSDPSFADVNTPAGSDGVFGTWDDGLKIDSNSPCIDAADGNAAPLADILGFGRADINDVNNTGTGEPNYADMGAYEKVTVAEIKVTHIKFDHSAGDSNDGIDIRENPAKDISVPEWVNGGQNKPAAYKKSINVTIMARFTVSPSTVTSAKIRASTSDAILGNLGEQTVSFTNGISDGNNGYVSFTPANSTPDAVGRGTVTWRWKARDIQGADSEEYKIGSGPHTIYTVLATPPAPSAEPRTGILDYSCEWADGNDTKEQACAAILRNGFFEHYSYAGNCITLSGDFVWLVSSLGINASRHEWSDQMLTREIKAVGRELDTYDWASHQWSEAEVEGGKINQYDPTHAYVLSDASWGDYEDDLFAYYKRGGEWVDNEPGQGQGGTHVPDPALGGWGGPLR